MNFNDSLFEEFLEILQPILKEIWTMNTKLKMVMIFFFALVNSYI